jgi:hypothetical protein
MINAEQLRCTICANTSIRIRRALSFKNRVLHVLLFVLFLENGVEWHHVKSIKKHRLPFTKDLSQAYYQRDISIPGLFVSSPQASACF